MGGATKGVRGRGRRGGSRSALAEAELVKGTPSGIRDTYSSVIRAGKALEGRGRRDHARRGLDAGG